MVAVPFPPAGGLLLVTGGVASEVVADCAATCAAKEKKRLRSSKRMDVENDMLAAMKQQRVSKVVE